MSETSVVAVRAAVFWYEAGTNSWKSVDEGMSRVDLYMSSTLGSFRVVAVSAKSGEVGINSPLYRDVKYQRVTNLFHQWSDTRLSYGLNFASLEEAQSFAQAIDAALLKLAQPTGPAPLTHVQHGRTNSTTRIAIGSAAAAAAAAMSPQMTPQSTPTTATRDIPPPPFVTQEDLAKKLAERRALDDPQARRSSGLIGARPPMPPPATSGTGSSSPGTKALRDIDSLREELIAVIKKEIEQAKREILEQVSAGPRRVTTPTPSIPPPPV